MKNKIWIFNRLDNVSGEYHPGGGLVLISKSLEQAKFDLEAHKYITIKDEDWAEALKGSTDLPTQIIVFADSGCC